MCGPVDEGAEYKGVLKSRDFRPIAGFISELMEVKSIVTMEGE